ncbi:MAG: SCO1664 family protein [Thermoflexales bacterium]|nr:SCO1664 family protein [Thermoflexales bacterium]
MQWGDMTQSELLDVLATGEMTPLGTLPWGSNYTFLTQITAKSPKPRELLAVYKPRRGEAPLWDFPTGTLCLREYAAWLVSEALGWQLVPPTVLRSGDYGFGSVQLFIENDPNQHYFTFRDDPSVCDQLRRIAVFDLITNNADRKSGHCLRDLNGRVWAIDHGICFNAEYKLRTVIWDFAGQPIPEELLHDLERLRTQVEPHRTLGKALRQLLSAEEVTAFAKRIEGLLRLRVFPGPSRYERNIPWPPV